MNQEIIGFINLGILSLIFILLLILMINYRKIEGYFTLLKFKIVNRYVINPTSKKDVFKFTIYNAALNDARLSSFGYSYQQKSIDFYQDYLAIHQLETDHEAIIPSRGSFNFDIAIEPLADLIQDINQGGYKVKRISLFAISSLGQVTTIKSRMVSKHVKRILLKRFKAEQKRIRFIKVEQRRIKAEKLRKKTREIFLRMGLAIKKLKRTKK
jgi:hypothetical protein